MIVASNPQGVLSLFDLLHIADYIESREPVHKKSWRLGVNPKDSIIEFLWECPAYRYEHACSQV